MKEKKRRSWIVPHWVNEPLRKNQSRAPAVSSQPNTDIISMLFLLSLSLSLSLSIYIYIYIYVYIYIYRPAYRHQFIAETGLMFELMQMRL